VFLRDISIRRKLSLLTLCACAFALFIACIGLAIYERAQFRESMVTELSTLADTLGANTAASVAFNDQKSARDMLLSLRSERHILAAFLYDEHGGIFAGYLRDNAHLEVPEWRQDGVEFGQKTLTLFRSVSLNGDNTGSIAIISDLSGFNAQFLSYGKIAIVVLVLSLVPTLFVSSRILRVVIAPILHLSDLAARVSAQEDYSLRVAVSGNDELGSLTRAFNHMLDCIHQRDAALQEANDELEARVQRRTSELQQEILERREAEAAMRKAKETAEFLGYYDALTGLPNRVLLRDRIGIALASAHRRGEQAALLFIDLDQFKTINDSLGHSAGDLLLREVAARLKQLAREQDTVSRLGGDEFVLLLTAVKEAADAAVCAQRIINEISDGFVLLGQLLHVTCSIGIGIFPDHGEDAEELIKNSDAAMYCAKECGRNNFQFFTDKMNAQVRERLAIESALRQAVERKQLFLVYQPQVNTVTGDIIGAEVLLRWQHPERGLIPPDLFIPIAENSGLIVPIGEWVLKHACAQVRQWQNEGLATVPVAVNVSAVQFRQKGFIEFVRAVLQQTGLSPQFLELELTETQIVSNPDHMLIALQELRDVGVKLSIDDFGTGYSNLIHLRRFPLSKLKIDRSFVRDVATNPDDAAITGTIIKMAKSLGLRVIAEGVENQEQISFLRDHDCEEIQGYYYSEPLGPVEFADCLRTGLPGNSRIAECAGIDLSPADLLNL
jgi:diguanylate cyclase (GGDEF)-like protein